MIAEIDRPDGRLALSSCDSGLSRSRVTGPEREAMSELFNGTWRIDVGASKVWDDARLEYAPDEVGDEIITLAVAGGVQDYEVLYGNDPTIRLGYTSRYDDPAWVPYLVRGIVGQPGTDVDEAVDAFRKRTRSDQGDRFRRFEVGRAYGLVRTVYVDERTHYRISKSAEDGQAQSAMLRRMSDDGESFTSTVLDLNGVVFRVRRFVRLH
jgi:hypothetical protein